MRVILQHFPFVNRLMNNKLKNILGSLFIRLKFGFIFCNVCGGIRKIRIKTNNLREDCICRKCSSITRKRHLASVFIRQVNVKFDIAVKSLRSIPARIDLSLYNLESNGALHNYLKHTGGYVCSEYFGTYEAFGDRHNGILNVDLMNTPFKDGGFNYIISTEVFEHIPDPYKAFRETYRILKTGGSHIFTVPYYPDKEKDEIRALLNADNTIVYLMQPEYHGDPVRGETGILVYTIFANEMIEKLEKIGFLVTFEHRINMNGIPGANNYVFTATKK